MDIQINKMLINTNKHGQKKNIYMAYQHIWIKILEIQSKDRLLNVVIEKFQVIHEDKHSRKTAGYSMETLKGTLALTPVFKNWKENNCQHRLPRFANSAFKTDGEMQTFHKTI